VFDFLHGVKVQILSMSQYYRDLHDRELLALAEAILEEVHARCMLDVFLPPDEASVDSHGGVFPRRLAAISNVNGRLTLHIERDFFQRSGSASA
jgi:hypothetical protein